MMGAWQVTIGLYATVLPFALLGAWLAVALWDLAGQVRDEQLGTGAAAGWSAAVLVVPVVGVAAYLLTRARLPRSLAALYLGGGVVAYLVVLLLTAASAAAG